MINKNFLEDLINEIVDMMADDLSADQIKKLRNVLHIKLKEYSIEKLISKIPWNSDCNISKLNKFISTKRLEGLSENSLEQYSRAIKNLFKEIQKPLDMINTDDIRYYLSKYNEERKVSNVTLNNMRRYFSTFFQWCSDEDIIEKNPMRRIKTIKQFKAIKEPFSDIEMEKIRQASGNLRNKALIEFLYSTGCRVSEVVGLNIKNVDFIHNSVIVNGKGNKQREVYISDKAMYWLNKYINSRKDNDSALFMGKGSKRLQKAGIEAALRKIGQVASVEKVHPHRFRRTLATNLINKGMPVQEVQQILGHSKIDTTMIYCTVDKNNVQAAHRKYAA